MFDSDAERERRSGAHRVVPSGPGGRPEISDYLLAMRHELKAPLNAVIGMSGLLLDADLGDRHRQYAKSIHLAGESLATILNDLLDLSRIVADRLTIEPIAFDLKSMVEETAKAMAMRADERGLALRVDWRPELPRHVMGDPGRTRQVLGNLVGHAMNSTSQGEVVIEVAPDGESLEGKARIRFAVEDTGIGLPQERLARVFNEYVPVDASPYRSFGVSGLGLRVSAELIQLMGGDLGAESEIGKGSRFWFRLPMPAVDAEPQPAALEQSGSGRALVIESDQTSRRRFAEQLEAAGWTVEFGDDLASVETLLRAAATDGDPFQACVLSDYAVRPSHAELAMHLKADDQLASVALVMVTAVGSPGEGKRLWHAGFAAYLRKPVPQDEVHDTLVALSSLNPDGRGQGLITRHSLAEAKNAQSAAQFDLIDEVLASLTRSEPAQVLLIGASQGDRAEVEAAVGACELELDPRATLEEALERISRRRYALILVDADRESLDLSDTGRRLTSALESAVHGPELVALSIDPTRREELLSAGFARVLPKPIRRDDLDRILADAVEATTVVEPTDQSTSAAVAEPFEASVDAPTSGEPTESDWTTTTIGLEEEETAEASEEQDAAATLRLGLPEATVDDEVGVAGLVELDRPETDADDEIEAAGPIELDEPETDARDESRAAGPIELDEPETDARDESRAAGPIELDEPETDASDESRAAGGPFTPDESETDADDEIRAAGPIALDESEKDAGDETAAAELIDRDEPPVSETIEDAPVAAERELDSMESAEPPTLELEAPAVASELESAEVEAPEGIVAADFSGPDTERLDGFVANELGEQRSGSAVVEPIELAEHAMASIDEAGSDAAVDPVDVVSMSEMVAVPDDSSESPEEANDPVELEAAEEPEPTADPELPLAVSLDPDARWPRATGPDEASAPTAAEAGPSEWLEIERASEQRVESTDAVADRAAEDDTDDEAGSGGPIALLGVRQNEATLGTRAAVVMPEERTDRKVEVRGAGQAVSETPDVAREHLPVIGSTIIEQLSSGTAGFAQHLVATFLREAPQRIAELEQGLSVADPKLIGDAARNLKAMGGILGAARLGAISDELAAAAGEGDLAQAAQLAGDVETAFLEVRMAAEGAAPPEAKAPLEIPAINEAFLRQLSPEREEGTRGLALKLVANFRAEAPNRLGDLTEAIEREDAAAVQRLAPTLKGMSSLIGADALAKVCALVEADARLRRIGAARRYVDQLELELSRVLAALEHPTA
ncbi:MAG: ATP-binding protein [Gemmatimonadales bacterium]